MLTATTDLLILTHLLAREHQRADDATARAEQAERERDDLRAKIEAADERKAAELTEDNADLVRLRSERGAIVDSRAALRISVDNLTTDRDRWKAKAEAAERRLAEDKPGPATDDDLADAFRRSPFAVDGNRAVYNLGAAHRDAAWQAATGAATPADVRRLTEVMLASAMVAWPGKWRDLDGSGAASSRSAATSAARDLVAALTAPGPVVLPALTTSSRMLRPVRRPWCGASRCRDRIDEAPAPLVPLTPERLAGAVERAIGAKDAMGKAYARGHADDILRHLDPVGVAPDQAEVIVLGYMREHLALLDHQRGTGDYSIAPGLPLQREAMRRALATITGGAS